MLLLLPLLPPLPQPAPECVHFIKDHRVLRPLQQRINLKDALKKVFSLFVFVWLNVFLLLLLLLPCLSHLTISSSFTFSFLSLSFTSL